MRPVGRAVGVDAECVRVYSRPLIGAPGGGRPPPGNHRTVPSGTGSCARRYRGRPHSGRDGLCPPATLCWLMSRAGNCLVLNIDHQTTARVHQTSVTLS